MTLFGLRWQRLHHSILFRVLVFSVLSIITIEGARAFYTLRTLKAETAANFTAGQLAMAQGVAAGIAQKIVLRQSAIDGVALAVPTPLINQPVALRNWLMTQQRVLPPVFDGLSVERLDGSVIATYPPQARPFEAANGSANQTAQVIQVGHVNGVPSVSMTSTLGPSNGNSGIVVRGLTSLVVPGFFDAVQTHQNGRTGGIVVVFSPDNQYLDLSQPKARLQALPSPVGETLFTLSADAVPPSSALIGLGGQQVLAAAAQVPGLAWQVVASIPSAEAFSSYEGKAADMLLMVLISMAPLPLYACFVANYYILRPLRPAAELVNQMSRGETPMARLPIARHDEIGALTAAFNRLLDRLDEQSRELGTQKESAEAAALAKSRFLAAASHDLRQPMHALNLYLGALDQFELPATARPVMASARECAKTMDEMFRALLDISKLDASTMQANIRTFAIAPLLEKIKISYVQQAQAKGLELRVAPCSAFVASDPELLERVLSNLLSNAVRYTENGKILLGCRHTTTGLRLGVYDTGPGIALDQQQAVFEEFYQVGNPERNRAHGLGLGLAIVQRLGVLLKAPLTLHSEPGRGSVFSIEVQRAHPIALISAVPGVERTAPQVTLSGALIVVVDDEPAILDATSLVLRQWGCKVVSAASGAEAIERLSLCERVPDAIVCDHRLLGTETGVDVIEALRSEFNFDIPALLITGDTSPERMQSILTTGIPVLNKPLQDHVLINALSGLVKPRLG